MIVPELKRRIKKLKSEHRAEIAFIDYLSILETDDALPSRNDRTIIIIAGLKALAAETDMPVIALLQISVNPYRETNAGAVLKHCAIVIHLRQSNSGEWKLLMSNRIMLAK
jgi:replicative DNA helicase